jgi:hypothetical protein
VFAIITAFFGIVLISVATQFLIRMWQDYYKQIAVGTTAVLAVAGLWLLAFSVH